MFSKEKLPFNLFLTLELNNLWFMDVKLIPEGETSILLAKYNKEILNILRQYDNVQNSLEKYLSKLLKQDLSIEKRADSQKSYCLKAKDSFQSKMLRFVVIIKIDKNQLEFKLNITNSVFQASLDYRQDLIKYLRNEVLEKMFPN